MPGYPTDRVIVYNRDATFAFELTPDEQRSRLRIEEINGEHSLTVKTTRKLSEGMRLITQDDTGKIREHVVYKPDEEHSAGKCAIGTYLCMWSLQYDLMGAYAKNHAEPGMGSSCSSRDAVIAALDGQSLWTVGTCDVPAVAAGKGCVMIGVSDWERLSLVVKHWGGEIDSDIVMDDTRVVSRKVNFLAHLGSTEVKRRFDWAEDLTSIDRHEDPGPYYCRIVPLGRGQREYAEDDETEFDWPLDISEEMPDGRVYIEDSESALVFRTKLPDGTWHYPTKVVKYDEDDPELLLNAGTADLHNHTRPGCSYEANVLQFARAGMDAKGVQLGDNTQCIDFGFNPDAGLTVEGRVTRLEVEELAPETKTNLTIGDLAPTFAQTMQELIGRQTASISDGIKRIEGGGTIAYVQNLLEEINAQIAADGGYTYLVGGQGSITYDKAVADPTIGTEATKVTQIKGGGIRIADEKKPSFSGIEDWVWKSLIVAGHIAAELVTAAHITAGYIGSQNDAVFLDFDNHVFEIGNAASIGDTTVADLMQDVASAGIDTIEYGTSASSTTAPTTWSTTAPASVAKGSWLWVKTTYKDSSTSMTKAYAGTDGQNGQDGADGIGIASVTPQYYLSTSSTSATGGSWSNIPPTWSANHYIWTRSLITWDTTPSTTSTTTEVYDAALTQANQQAAQAIADAADAAKVATNYLTFDSTNGLDVGYSGTSAKTRVSGSGVELFDGDGVQAAYFGMKDSVSYAQIGRSNSTHIEIPQNGLYLYREFVHSTPDFVAKIVGVQKYSSIYCTVSFGERTAGETEGAGSFSCGYLNTASETCSAAFGSSCEARGPSSFAAGRGAKAVRNYSAAFGTYNISSQSNMFSVGNGTFSNNADILHLDYQGNLWIAGSLTQNSDRRLKEHHAYLGEDACDFIRALKPALFTKDGERHVGFYAQDVQEAEPDEWDTVTVTSQHTDESLDFDPLSLDYTALIAPLVAYTQQLEKRVEAQDKTIESMEARLAKLEAKLA